MIPLPRHQWNDASLYYETTASIRGRRVDKRSASTGRKRWWMRFAYPPYAGTFFICWGDETLKRPRMRFAERRRQTLLVAQSDPQEAFGDPKAFGDTRCPSEGDMQRPGGETDEIVDVDGRDAKR